MSRRVLRCMAYLAAVALMLALSALEAFTEARLEPSSSTPAAYVSESGGYDTPHELAAHSGLTVLSITTSDGALPGDEYAGAQLEILHMEGGYLSAQAAPILIKERGNTSRRFPKKSYRISVVDEDGQKDNLSIAGLRSDDDWILNPMYTDTSKIREALAYELWDEINSSGVLAASSRVAYAEVYIDGEYWGLYGVQERIDRKQVNADKRSGILYKVAANDRPTAEELISCTDEARCGGIELAFAGVGVSEPWLPAAAYMALLNGEEVDVDAGLSLSNAIDYGLWAMLTQAHDCHFKNQFLNCVYEGGHYTIYKLPWDLNNTFGDIWRNDAQETNYTRYSVGDLVLDGTFELLLESGDKAIAQQVQARWQQLREQSITEEALIARANALYAPLVAAIERDSMRWPLSGMGNGNATNIRDIEGFIRLILPRMDEYICSLGADA